MRQETFKFGDLVHLILEVWQYHIILLQKLLLWCMHMHAGPLGEIFHAGYHAQIHFKLPLQPVFALQQKQQLTCISKEFSISCDISSLWPCDAVWRHRCGSTFAQVMACCLVASSHYLNWCGLRISEVLWHSPKINFRGRSSRYQLMKLVWKIYL